MTSFHTKFRPQKFEDVIGQDTAVRSLRRVVKDKRAHAFMFVGPAGTGKTTLARILANEFAGAGNVKAANLIEHDAASKSGADDMRSLVSSLQFRAVGGSPIKFVIIDECHKLSSAAWTVLLKPTEEPPAHVYFAFCTTELGKIPKANITRCLRYDLKPVKEELLFDLVAKVVDSEKLSVDDEIIEAIAENSSGSPRQALVNLEECIHCKNANEAREVLRTAGQSKQIVDLCRWLVAGKAHSWAEAQKYLKALDGMEAESCRIVVSAYLTAVLLNTKNDKGAARMLFLLDCFSKPYSQSDKLAPLCLSIGLALGLDQ